MQRIVHLAGQLRRLVAAELGTVIGLGLIAGSLFVFLEVLDEVRDGEVRRLDVAILEALRTTGDRADPIGPAWLEAMVRDITALGGTAVLTLITAAVIGYLLIDRRPGTALWVLIAVGGGTLLSQGLKVLFDRPRPDLVAHLAEAEGLSFPSGHAMLSAVTYLTLGALLSRIETQRRVKAYTMAVAVLLTLLVGASRVYLGVHWPSDVLAGWSLGCAWAILCWLVMLWLQRRGTVANEDEEPSAVPPRQERDVP